MSKPQLKNSNVRFKFEYVVNGRSNNFFLDNIKIGEQDDLMIVGNTATANSRISTYPNPVVIEDGDLYINLENIIDKNIEVMLVNILGAEFSIYSGKVPSNSYTFKVKSADLMQFEQGIYFVKVVNNGEVIMTDKLFIFR